MFTIARSVLVVPVNIRLVLIPGERAVFGLDPAI
jgi:hypothetical protein